jgi:hypothetical protein
MKFLIKTYHDLKSRFWITRKYEKNHLLKRMVENSSSNHHQSKDDKVEFRNSEKKKNDLNIWS